MLWAFIVLTVIVFTNNAYALGDHDHFLEKSDVLTGNFDPSKHGDFELLPKVLTTRPTYLRKTTLQAFIQLAEAARKDNIRLRVVSGFRSHKHQEDIWNQKFKSYSHAYPNVSKRVESIMQYSAIPGISRHHWGTDIDINSFDNNYFTHGEGKKVHEWLKVNAEKYGFYLTYTFGRSGGYKPEMWHYTHYPSSSKFMKEYYLYMNPQTLKPFKGVDSIDLEKVFYEYSFNINPLILKRLQLDGITIVLTF